MAKKWIQGAIKHPGALHHQLGIPQGETIPAKQLAFVAKKGGKLGRRARLAQTLRKMQGMSEHMMVTSKKGMTMSMKECGATS